MIDIIGSHLAAVLKEEWLLFGWSEYLTAGSETLSEDSAAFWENKSELHEFLLRRAKLMLKILPEFMVGEDRVTEDDFQLVCWYMNDKVQEIGRIDMCGDCVCVVAVSLYIVEIRLIIAENSFEINHISCGS